MSLLKITNYINSGAAGHLTSTELVNNFLQVQKESWIIGVQKQNRKIPVLLAVIASLKFYVKQ